MPKLGLAVKEDYIHKGGNFCPYCYYIDFFGDIEGDSVDIGSGRATQEMHCLNCDNQWTDVYKLVDIWESEPVYTVHLQITKHEFLKSGDMEEVIDKLIRQKTEFKDNEYPDFNSDNIAFSSADWQGQTLILKVQFTKGII